MIIVRIKGGLGNQLFQYATARNISINKQVPLKVDTSFFNDSRYEGIFRLNQYNIQIEEAKKDEVILLTTEPSASFYSWVYRKLRIQGKYYKKTHIIENSHSIFDKRIINCTGIAYIEGWCQNEDYFSSIRDILIKEFTLKNIANIESECIKKDIDSCESVSIHFRRGEYLNNKFFGVVPLNYYYQAVNYINKMVKHPEYFVFSDDIEWVKNNFKIDGTIHYLSPQNERASIHHTENDFKDLELMKYCKHNIIANSSFSWWAAWLNTNPDKIVIAPKRWYDDPIAQKYFEKGRLKVSDWNYI